MGRRELRDLRDRSPNGIPSFPQPDGPARRMVAMYDYDPRQLSPNVDAEVCLVLGIGRGLVSGF